MPNLRGKTWTTTTPANVGDAQYWEDHLISDAVAAKAASSVQSVNNTAPDEQGNVDIVTLPDGGTAGQVLTKQSSVDGDADWEDPASSGHTIEDEDGNTMPYQSTLQFENAEVTNDSVNNKTIVDCKGSKGDAATITVGTVTTLPAGSDATVTNSGTSSDAVFDFGIPKGADGAEEEIEQIYADNGVLGAKNRLPLSLEEIKSLNSARTWVGNSCDHNGITFTVNTDANGNVTSISESGTASGFAFLRLARVSSFNGSFILNKGISANKIVYIQNETTNVQIAASTGGDVLVNLTPTNDDVNCVVGINQGQAGAGTIYPMLRLASDPDDTYVPYAMTNRELTEEKLSISELKTIASSAADFAAFKTAIANL